jgi:hypothetical protein
MRFAYCALQSKPHFGVRWLLDRPVKPGDDSAKWTLSSEQRRDLPNLERTEIGGAVGET